MAVLCRVPCAAPASGIQERRPLCQQRRLEQVCNGHQGPCKRTTDQLASSLELHLLLFRYSIVIATYLSPIASFPVLPTPAFVSQPWRKNWGEKAFSPRLRDKSWGGKDWEGGYLSPACAIKFFPFLYTDVSVRGVSGCVAIP